MYCDQVLRRNVQCGLRPGHPNQHRGKDTLTYCTSCDRPMHRSSVAGWHEEAGPFCFMCVRVFNPY